MLAKAHEVEEKNLDSALVHTQRAYLLSQKIDYKWGIGEALHRFGTIQSQKGNNDSAIKLLRLALNIRHEIKDKRYEAYTSSNLSNAFQQKGIKDSALHYLFLTLDLYKNLMDSAKIGETYNEISNFYFEYGDNKTALDILSTSLKIFEDINDVDHLSETYTLYGIIYYYSLDFEKALPYFLKALQADRKSGKELLLARDLNYLGLCYEALGKDAAAHSSFLKALSFYTSYGETPSTVEVLYNLGVYFKKKNSLDSCLFYLEKSKKLIENTQAEDMKLTIFFTLAEVYALKGNYLKAYGYHLQYSDLNDSILNKQKISSIAEMQTKYDTEKKEQQITLLAEQNKTKTAQRNALIAGSIVLLLLFLGSGIYFVQRNRIAKKNELIAREKISGLLKEQEIKSYNAMIEGQEEERKRIATDLHDRLGSMLSTVKLLFGALNDKIDKNQEENVQQYQKATKIIDEAVVEVRRISHNLSTGMLNNFGLVVALEELCESIHNSKIIRCKLLAYGLDARLDSHIEIGIFRMVQEIVNNTIKHAKAKTLTVQLNHTGDSVNVTVEDDGIGFDVREKRKRGGIGLKNLELRAQKINGKLNIDSSPGRGTITTIEIPLTDNHV